MLTAFSITLVVGVVAFAVGVIFSTKIKDKIRGIPSDLRSDLNDVENSVLNRVRVATGQVVADVHAATAVNPPAQAAPAPAAPAAPAAPNAT